MADLETLILRAGAVAITILAVARVVWHDLNNLITVVRRKRKRRR